MAKRDKPKYVRLAAHRSRTVLADVRGGSGWKISGIDVQEYPSKDDSRAVTFVDHHLGRGNLEPCSKAEYDEVQSINQESSKLATEAERSAHATESVDEIVSKREAAEAPDEEDDDDEPSEDDDTEGDDSDDDEEGDDEDDGLMELTVKELRDRLKAEDLPVSGTHDELVDRLRSNQ